MFCCCVVTPVPPPFAISSYLLLTLAFLLTDHSFYSLFIFQYDSNILAPAVAPQEKKLSFLHTTSFKTPISHCLPSGDKVDIIQEGSNLFLI